MHVRFVSPAGVEVCDAAELPALLARDDGLVWVDVPVWDEQAEQTLRSTFGFHPLAVRDSANRNQVPKIHRYEDHLFLVLHAPQPGAGGHVHYVELDQFIGDRYLVTVHGPLNPAVDQASAMVEVDTVLGRLTSGKLKPDRGLRAFLRPADRVDRAPARLHRGADQRCLEARTARHRRPSRRSRIVSRRDVSGAARSAHGQHHVRAEPRGADDHWHGGRGARALRNQLLHAEAQSGLTVALFSRSLFGYLGASIATIIFAITGSTCGSTLVQACRTAKLPIRMPSYPGWSSRRRRCCRTFRW